MPHPDIAGVDLVIGKIRAPQRPGFIISQMVFGNLSGIEFDLDLHIIRNWKERTVQLINQDLLRLGLTVDIGGLPIAVLSSACNVALSSLPRQNPRTVR